MAWWWRASISWCETLQAYLRDESDVEDVFCGHFRNNRESISLLDQDEQIKATVVDRWIAQKKHAKLVDVWVKGLSWDWRKLYPSGVPQKMSLPTYPFAKERYWVDAETSAEFFDGMGGASASAMLHPLLHTNTSTMRQQSYRSRFDGTEFFLADHRVRIGDQGVLKVLPGVAYLEMAREAISQAVFAPGQAEQLELSNVIWIRPLTVQDKQDVSIALFARDENAQAEEIIDFSIFSESRDGQNIHCQGEVLLMPVPAPARLDVEYLEAQMTQGRMEGPRLYEALAAMGLKLRSRAPVAHFDRAWSAAIARPSESACFGREQRSPSVRIASESDGRRSAGFRRPDAAWWGIAGSSTGAVRDGFGPGIRGLPAGHDRVVALFARRCLRSANVEAGYRSVRRGYEHMRADTRLRFADAGR